MLATVSCFVDPKGKLSLEGGAGTKVSEYHFDLERRRVFYVQLNRGSVSLEEANYQDAQEFFNQYVGTPEKLMEFARQSHLDKASLTALLVPKIRKMFLSVCDILEKGAIKDCGSSKDPWLKNICEFECFKTCIDIWVDKFQYPENRIAIWRK